MNDILKEDAQNILGRVSLERISEKTLLILGSNGLIGSQLARVIFYANRKFGLNTRVIGISRHYPNFMLTGLTDDPRFSFYAQDLAHGFKLEEKVDFIAHCATYAQPKKFLADRLSTIKLNTTLTESLLNRCCCDGTSLLFVSSAAVYGQPDAAHIPTTETYYGYCSTTAPRSAYWESKRLGETLCGIFRDGKGVDVRIARVSPVYGPGISIHDDRVLGNFLRKALLQGHIELLDQGDQMRTWCYITDVSVMLLKVFLQGHDFIYNVGGKDTLTIRELAEMVCDLTGATYSLPRQNVTGAPEQSGWADHLELDITKITSEFDLGEFVTLRQGLHNVIQWNREAVLPALRADERKARP
jgi:dTDP-glucose 4,6-dehydratase/UDP-glucuronate decarboxylase